MQVYSSEGFVKSVETENLGYDLSICDVSSEIIKLKVEVKGTSCEEEVFYLTRNEYREAYKDPKRWRLAIVVNALASPSLQEYRVDEMEKNSRCLHLHGTAHPRGHKRHQFEFNKSFKRQQLLRTKMEHARL